MLPWRIRLVLCFLLLHGCQSANWTGGPQDGAIIYACAGDTLLLPWKFALSQGDVIQDARWFYDGHSQEIIAFYTHGVFSPLPAFSQRVQFVANGGLQMDHVTTTDAGSYTVEVVGSDASGAAFTLKRSVTVQVSRGLLTSDGQVHVSMTSTPVLDPGTDAWTIELRCGHFLFNDSSAPFDVQWKTPSDHTHASNGYANGQFSYLLPTPLSPGNYTCKLPAQTPHTCLHHDVSDSLFIDDTQTRLALLEASVRNTNSVIRDTKTQLSETKTQLADTRVELNGTRAQLGDAVTKLSEAMTQLYDAKTQLNDAKDQIAGLHAENTHLQQQLMSFEDRTEREARISFYARNMTSPGPTTYVHSGATLVMSDVITNEGNAYNRTTGVFYVPHNGTYYMAATSATGHAQERLSTVLVVDGRSFATATIYENDGFEETASLNSVLHLRAGQRVWLKAQTSATYQSELTTFCGFLVYLDP